jgi:hypothetical protein
MFAGIAASGYSLNAQNKQNILKIDHVTYITITEKTFLEENAIRFFHGIFIEEEKTAYEQFNIKMPEFQTIVLTANSKIFSDLTSKNRHTASLFDPVSGRIYFQNPRSLKNKHILRKSVKHELCHQAANSIRSKKTKSFELEECVCEGYSGESEIQKIIPSRIKSYREFLLYLRKELRSKEAPRQIQAYRAAGSFGNYIIQKTGYKKALEIIASPLNYNDLVSKYFEEYAYAK